MHQKKTQTNLFLAFSATIITAALFLFLFLNIGIKSRRYTFEDSKTLAREISGKAATQTEVYLSSALNQARLLTERALIYRKLGGSRKDILEFMRHTLEENPDIMGVWTMWEPGAFDNQDFNYRNDTLFDRNGSMSLAFFKHGDRIYVERNDPADFAQDYYTYPLKVRKELILDPFQYQYHGYEYVYYQTSAVYPVIVDSVFLGVFGIDIDLDSLQSRLKRIRLYETGYLSLITGSGIIVSHADSAMVNRNFFDVLMPEDRENYSALHEGKELTIETKSTSNGDRVFRFFYPVQAGRGARPWHIMVEIPVDQAAIHSRQLLYTAYGTLILGLFLLSYLIINIYDRRKYEKSMLDAFHQVEESKRIVTESEQNFRNIFDKSKDVIIILGSDTRILAANKAFTTVTGYSLDDKPLYVSDILLSDQDNPVKERLSMLSDEDNLQPFEYKVKLRDGQIRITESNSSSIDYYGQKAFLIMLRDVTELREAEHQVLNAIIRTEENERSRIAQDLHDGLGPVLSTIKIYFQVYQDTQDEGKRTELSGKLKKTIEEAIKSVSEISHNISPHVLRNYGFYKGIRQFIHHIELTQVVQFKVNFNNEPELGENSGIILYRAITELINNSLRHAGSNNIFIEFRQIRDTLQVSYADDGRGFDTGAVIGSPGRGSGVQNILNRIKALHGSVEITSIPGRGMSARISIPV